MTHIREWLPVPVAARFFGQSHWTIRTWANRGIVRRSEDDGQVLVHTGDLAKRLAELKAATDNARQVLAAAQDVTMAEAG